MKKILFVFFLCFGLLSYSQNNPRKYFDNVNKAELSIIDSNYKDAISYYKVAFKNLDEPLGRDISNFVECCIILNDSIGLQEMVPFYRRRNYEYSYLIKRDKDIVNSFQEQILNSEIKSGLDTNFIRYIFELIQLDQKFRIAEDKGKGFIQDSINMQRLYDYMLKHNKFIDEKTIGNISVFKKNWTS